jgi:hypothetical protein
MVILQGLHNDIETLPHVVNGEHRATSISLFNLALLNTLRLEHLLLSSRLLVEEELKIFLRVKNRQTT